MYDYFWMDLRLIFSQFFDLSQHNIPDRGSVEESNPYRENRILILNTQDTGAAKLQVLLRTKH